MKFGRPPKAEPFLNPKSQFRLFRLVMLLGLMLIGVQWVSQKEHWEWLVPSKSQSPPLPSLTKLDFQVKTDSASPALAPGEIRIATPGSPDLPAVQFAGVDSSGELPADWLAEMDDGRLGLLRSEQASIDQVLERVRSLSEATLHTAASHDVGFVTLNDRPSQYRGKRLGFQGILWKLSLLEEGAEPRSGDPVYDAWLYTPDAANNPTRVLFTELPATLNLGEQLDQPIEFSGYFIKRYGYATPGGTHVAPLFVARTLALRPFTAATAKVKTDPPWGRWLAGLIAACAASGFLIWRLARDMRPSRSRDFPAQRSPLNISGDDEVAKEADFDNNHSA